MSADQWGELEAQYDLAAFPGSVEDQVDEVARYGGLASRMAGAVSGACRDALTTLSDTADSERAAITEQTDYDLDGLKAARSAAKRLCGGT